MLLQYLLTKNVRTVLRGAAAAKVALKHSEQTTRHAGCCTVAADEGYDAGSGIDHNASSMFAS